jgi:hypothetical protein
MIKITPMAGLACCRSATCSCDISCDISPLGYLSQSPALDDPDHRASKLDHIVCRLGRLVRTLPNTLRGSATVEADQIVLGISLILGQISQSQCAAMQHLQHLLQGCFDAHAFSPHLVGTPRHSGLGGLGAGDADRGNWIPSRIGKDVASLLISR